MTTLRSNNSKNINPIFKYFTDLKNSDKFALIKHSHSTLRPFLLPLRILCKKCLLSCDKEIEQQPTSMHGLMSCYDCMSVCMSVCVCMCVYLRVCVYVCVCLCRCTAGVVVAVTAVFSSDQL